MAGLVGLILREVVVVEGGGCGKGAECVIDGGGAVVVQVVVEVVEVEVVEVVQLVLILMVVEVLVPVVEMVVEVLVMGMMMIMMVAVLKRVVVSVEWTGMRKNWELGQ